MENDLPTRTVKSPGTFEEQINILRGRGLVINNEDTAKRTLQRINYYRLSAYGLSLKQDDIYHSDATFDQMLALYEFDRKFRYIIMEMVEQVEIAFRTHISYYIAHTYGPLGHFGYRAF
jgi:abortive infection bacteriophage resistance protein